MPRCNTLGLLARMQAIDAVIFAKLRAGIRGGIIYCVHLYLHAITIQNEFETIVAIIIPTFVFCVVGWSIPHAIVLQAAIYIIRLGIVNGHAIELSHRWRIGF